MDLSSHKSWQSTCNVPTTCLQGTWAGTNGSPRPVMRLMHACILSVYVSYGFELEFDAQSFGSLVGQLDRDGQCLKQLGLTGGRQRE